MTGSLSARRRLAAVLCGGFCGTITRYVFSSLVQAWLGKGWPYDLLLINVTGALLLAFVTTLADATFLVGPTHRLFINVGFLGAYTTFSSLVLGDVLLFGGNQPISALLYMLLSVVGGVLAVLLGDILGQWFINRSQRSVSQARATRKLSGMLSERSFHKPMGTDHLNVQDDRLLPERGDEHETRQQRL